MRPQDAPAAVLPLLLLFTLTLIAASPVAPKVKVTVFQESLCPDSRFFTLYELYPLWFDLSDIIQLDNYFYGKATEHANGSDYTWSCQHGYKECQGNIMLTCAKKYIEDECQLMNFTACVMDRLTGTSAGPLCAEEVGVDFQNIETCYNSSEGSLLQHEVGVVQGTLAPNLTDVPWILINDVSIMEQLDASFDLRMVVCEAYEGEKPDLC